MIHTHHLPLARENNPSAVFWQLLGHRSVRLIIAEESTDYKPIPLLFSIFCGYVHYNVLML